MIYFSFLFITLVCFGVSDRSVTEMQFPEKTENGMEIPMKNENQIPQFLYKIVSPEEWLESNQRDQVVTLLIDKGFIHLATEGQIPHIVQKFWNGKPYIILKLNSKKLIGRWFMKTIQEEPLNTTIFTTEKFPWMQS